MRVTSALMDSYGRLKEAMARQETAGTDISALEVAAAAIGQGATAAKDVMFRVSKVLPRRAR
jgi:Holliday junction resolvasome RuvABC endonuclease subunit